MSFCLLCQIADDIDKYTIQDIATRDTKMQTDMCDNCEHLDSHIINRTFSYCIFCSKLHLTSQKTCIECHMKLVVITDQNIHQLNTNNTMKLSKFGINLLDIKDKIRIRLAKVLSYLDIIVYSNEDLCYILSTLNIDVDMRQYLKTIQPICKNIIGLLQSIHNDIIGADYYYFQKMKPLLLLHLVEKLITFEKDHKIIIEKFKSIFSF